MTPAQFKAARLSFGLTQKKMAAWLYTNERRVRAWEKGENPIPGGVRRALSLMKLIESLPTEKEVASFSGALLAGNFSINPHYIPLSIDTIIKNISGVINVRVIEDKNFTIRLEVTGGDKSEIANAIFENLYIGATTMGNTTIIINYGCYKKHISFDYIEV